MEGSFDNDVLIGDSRKNSILGQPGEDRIYGGGGEDTLDARDGVRDEVIQCSPGHPVLKGSALQGRRPLRNGGPRSGHAFIDSFDPSPIACAETTEGHPVPGLGKSANDSRLAISE
jgi:Ca2+-binding RTX toxin-like protein